MHTEKMWIEEHNSPCVATQTHRRTQRRTGHRIASPQNGTPTSTGGEAPATAGKRCAQAARGRPVSEPRSTGTHRDAQQIRMRRYKKPPVDPHGEATVMGRKTRAHANHGRHLLQPRRTGTHRDALEYSIARHPWARTGTHHHARQPKACRYNAAPRPLQPARLRPRSGKHVGTIIMAFT